MSPLAKAIACVAVAFLAVVYLAMRGRKAAKDIKRITKSGTPTNRKRKS